MGIRALQLCMSFLIQPFKTEINSDNLEIRSFVKMHSYFGERFCMVFAEVIHTVQSQHTRRCLTKIQSRRIVFETQFFEILRQNADLLFSVSRVRITIDLDFECYFPQFLQ